MHSHSAPGDGWEEGPGIPVDQRFQDWLTVGFERVVLVVARTTTALTRLLDVVALISADHRVQVVFTLDSTNSAVFGRGMDRLLHELDAAVIPWEQALRSRFGLVVAASENDRLHRLDGPILLLPHGFGFQKYYPGTAVVAGMNPGRLLHGGRVVPDLVAVSHAEQRAQLAAACPPAAARAVVVGDPAVDRLLASRHREPFYREALGAVGRKLVLLASTWGPRSLFGCFSWLPERLAGALPVDEYGVAVVLHPGVWAAHGPWQVRAWLARAEQAGVRVVAPGRWQAALVASDCVVSDESSLTLYAAVLDRPLLLAGGTPTHTVAGSPLAAVAERAPRLDVEGDLLGQVVAALREHRPGRWNGVVRPGIEQAGQCAAILRRQVYRLLRLSEPDDEAAFPSADLPAGPAPSPAVLLAGTAGHADVVSLLRLPGATGGEPHEAMDHRHLVVDVRRATVRQVGAATILHGLPDTADEGQFAELADCLLDQWPNAGLVAARADGAACRIRSRERTFTVRAENPPPGFDPILLASLVFTRLSQHGRLSTSDCLAMAGRVIEVSTVEAG